MINIVVKRPALSPTFKWQSFSLAPTWAQKVNYIHNNPVEAGFVNEPHEWRLSSANPNFEIKLAAL